MKIAVVGATGQVGRMMQRIPEEREFPVTELIPIATERSEGKRVKFGGEDVDGVVIDFVIRADG